MRFYILVELKAKSQVTIPKKIINSMELNQGDQFEVKEENGKIIKSLKASVDEIKKAVKNGNQPVFDSIDSLLAELDK